MSEHLHPQDPVAIAAQIGAILDGLGIAYAVGGAVAATLFGEPRATQDVDIVVALTPRNLPGLIAALEEAGYYVPHDAATRAVERPGAFNVVHSQSGVKADLFVAGRTPLDEDELRRRRAIPLSTPAGSHLWVVAAEDLIAQKLRWYADGGRVSDRQWRDVQGLLSVQKGRLDLTTLRDSAARLGVESLLDDALGNRES